MTVFFPGPQLIELEYTVDSLKHRMTMNVEALVTPDIGDPFADIDLKTKNLSTIAADAWVAIVEAVMDGMYSNSGVTFDIWNLYNVAPLSYDRTYISSEAVGAVTFTAPATVEWHHHIYTFRTTGGNLTKLYCMESNIGQNTVVPYASMQPAEKTFIDAFLVANTPLIGRDGNFVTGLISRGASQNEKLFRIRNR